MTAAKKGVNIILKILTGILAALFAVIALALIVYVLWSVFDRPVVVFDETEVTVELGSKFDPSSVISEVTNLPAGHISMDASEMDLTSVGDYEIRFAIDAFPVSKETLKKAHMDFLSPAEQVQILTVHVADVHPPVLEVKKGPVRVKRGTKLDVSDLVISVEDETSTAVTFADGSDEYLCDEEETKTVTIVAEDESGNRTEQDVVLLVEGEDETPPVIEGADDIVLQVGETFDPMEGVSARDNRDGDVRVALVEGEAPDMTRAGHASLTYRAVDKAGNETIVTRNAAVYDKTAGEGSERFGLLWDVTGRKDQPYLLAVNRLRNVVTVYAKGKEGNYTLPVKAFVCSVGDATPAGIFTTLERYRWHSLQEESFGQYATRITGHILFHSVPYYVNEDPSSLEYEEFNKLGTSASLGCVRMCVEDCKWVFDNCPEGFPCVIFDDDLSNGPLGKPVPVHIDESDEERRGWDPTDPDPASPWNRS